MPASRPRANTLLRPAPGNAPFAHALNSPLLLTLPRVIASMTCRAAASP